MIPEGTWKVRGTEGALGTSSTGNETVGISLTILEGEAKGSRITWYGFFTEKTFDRTIEALRHLGWEGNDISDLRGVDRLEAYAVIEHEADEDGELHAKVRWINSGGGVALKDRMDVGSAKAFAERVKGRVLALSQGQQSQSPANAQRVPRPQPRPAPAGPQQPINTNQDDSDIPF